MKEEQRVPVFKEYDPREDIKADITKFLIDLWANTPFTHSYGSPSHEKLYEFSQNINIVPEGQFESFRVNWNKIPSLEQLKEFRDYFAKMVIKHSMNYFIDRSSDCVVHLINVNPLLPRHEDQIIEVVVEKECVYFKTNSIPKAYITKQQAISFGFYSSMAELLYDLTTPSFLSNRMIINGPEVYLELETLFELYRRKMDVYRKEFEDKVKKQEAKDKKSGKKLR